MNLKDLQDKNFVSCCREFAETCVKVSILRKSTEKTRSYLGTELREIKAEIQKLLIDHPPGYTVELPERQLGGKGGTEVDLSDLESEIQEEVAEGLTEGDRARMYLVVERYLPRIQDKVLLASLEKLDQGWFKQESKNQIERLTRSRLFKGTKDAKIREYLKQKVMRLTLRTHLEREFGKKRVGFRVSRVPKSLLFGARELVLRKRQYVDSDGNACECVFPDAPAEIQELFNRYKLRQRQLEFLKDKLSPDIKELAQRRDELKGVIMQALAQVQEKSKRRLKLYIRSKKELLRVFNFKLFLGKKIHWEKTPRLTYRRFLNCGTEYLTSSESLGEWKTHLQNLGRAMMSPKATPALITLKEIRKAKTEASAPEGEAEVSQEERRDSETPAGETGEEEKPKAERVTRRPEKLPLKVSDAQKKIRRVQTKKPRAKRAKVSKAKTQRVKLGETQVLRLKNVCDPKDLARFKGAYEKLLHETEEYVIQQTEGFDR